jgi:addiction module HigA family antidote
MIKSFRHAGLEKFFFTGSKAGIQPSHARKLVHSGERQLAAHLSFRGRRRNPGRLPGLPLGGRNMRQMYNPAHPGSVLREWLGEMQVSAAAARLHVSRVTLSRILNGKAGISAEMSLRLSDALGTSPTLWIDLQTQYDLWQASRKRRPKIELFKKVA